MAPRRKAPIKDTINLLAAIEPRVQQVHTQSFDVSFNEIFDMKVSNEINITPEYQRLFVWSEGARSRFIESLLIEMPVPPIYVIEEDDGKYTLIDGLQRISSYLHFRGQLEAPHLDTPIKIGDLLTLRDCDIVPELNGLTFADLGTALQIRLKRAFVRLEVVRKGSNPIFKYHMFKRLNTGGQLLTDQQLRNCTIRLLDPTFNDFIIDLSKIEAYKSCISNISTEQRLGAYDQELVLRFLSLKNNFNNFKHDVADFMTDYMESVSDPRRVRPFNYPVEREIFTKTFEIFNRALSDKSFARAMETGTITRGFTVYHYEAFTLGIQPYVANIDIDNEGQIKTLKDAMLRIKQDREFIELTTGGGKNSPGPLNARVAFVRSRLRNL